MKHIFDYSQILDNLYIGSDLCEGGYCLIHGEEFRELGVSVELNLSQEANELPPKNIEIYSWIPVVDGWPPAPHQLDVGSSIIHEALSNRKKVYVHCKKGHGRSPTMVAAYLIRYKGYKVDQAIKLIRKKRPETHIEERQKDALEVFAKKWSR